MLGALDGRPDEVHFDHGEEVAWGVADQEGQDDAHEDDGQVVLLLSTGLLVGIGRLARHGHLPAIAVLDILVNLKMAKHVYIACA